MTRNSSGSCSVSRSIASKLSSLIKSNIYITAQQKSRGVKHIQILTMRRVVHNSQPGLKRLEVFDVFQINFHRGYPGASAKILSGMVGCALCGYMDGQLHEKNFKWLEKDRVPKKCNDNCHAGSSLGASYSSDCLKSRRQEVTRGHKGAVIENAYFLFVSPAVFTRYGVEIENANR